LIDSFASSNLTNPVFKNYLSKSISNNL